METKIRNKYSFINAFTQIKKEFKKGNRLMCIKRYAMIVIGTVFLSIASAFFLVPANIVSGGSTGIGIIIAALTGYNVNNIITILQVFFFILGYILLGADFTIKTLISTVLYPCFLYLFTFVYNKCPILQISYVDNGTVNVVNTLIAGVAGGAFIGLAVGFTLTGGGSTGGIDCVPIFIAKQLKIRPSIMTFTVDFLVILSSLFINDFILLLIGVFSSYIAAQIISKVHISSYNTYVGYIVSSKWEDINQIINEKLKRGTTLFDCEGGYTNERRKTIQVVFTYDEYAQLEKIIYDIDKRAFLTVLSATQVIGLGFGKEADKIVKNKDESNIDNDKINIDNKGE